MELVQEQMLETGKAVGVKRLILAKAELVWMWAVVWAWAWVKVIPEAALKKLRLQISVNAFATCSSECNILDFEISLERSPADVLDRFIIAALRY